MRAICAHLGIDDKVTPHDLRRTALGFGRDAMNRIQTTKKVASVPFTTGTAIPRKPEDHGGSSCGYYGARRGGAD